MIGSVPIACSLDGNEARRRWHEWSDVIGHRLGVDRSPSRLTVRFPLSAALSTKLGELVAAESQCCGFVGWQLDEQSDGLGLTIFGDPAGVLAMAESFGVSDPTPVGKRSLHESGS